jgi:hypothetical protein
MTPTGHCHRLEELPAVGDELDLEPFGIAGVGDVVAVNPDTQIAFIRKQGGCTVLHVGVDQRPDTRSAHVVWGPKA